MMDVLSETEIEDILAIESEPCASVYLPTHEKGGETKEDPIRFKNLLSQCEKRLRQRGVGDETIARLFRSAQTLLDTSVAWQHLERGLAVFISADIFRIFRLHFACPEQAWIGGRFYVKPLAPLWNTEHRFCILAVSQGQTKFYEADRYGVQERTLSSAPRDLREFLQYDDAEEHLQYHAAANSRSGGETAVFHGQGNIADEARHKKMVDEYVKAVRNAVEDYLAGSNRPLVLMAPTYVQSVYRRVSHYTYLLPSEVVLSPDQMSEESLYAAAQEAVRPHFQQQIRTRVDRYCHLLAHGQAVDEIGDIIAAAREGRVETLLLDPNVSVWATSGEVDSDEPAETRENRKDLLDLAARWTLAHGGEVYAVAREDLPSQSPAGATLRY